jgi:hypothetical protein
MSTDDVAQGGDLCKVFQDESGKQCRVPLSAAIDGNDDCAGHSGVRRYHGFKRFRTDQRVVAQADQNACGEAVDELQPRPHGCRHVASRLFIDGNPGRDVFCRVHDVAALRVDDEDDLGDS